MKFVFIPHACLPFHARTLEERPIGGIETGVIRMAEELERLGHEALVLSRFDNPPLSSPLYLPFSALQDIDSADVVIAVREWVPAFVQLPARFRLFWTGDSYDQPHNAGFGDKRVVRKIDAFLAVSEWHADTMCRASGYPRDKAWVIRNGVCKRYFDGTEVRGRKRLIYSSTPYRGLAFIPEIFARIRVEHPDAELHVFSGYGVYRGTAGYDPQAEREYEELRRRLEAIPGCVVHGNVLQAQLAREFMRSSVLLYPNSFEETSCITALEAQSGGCVVLSSKLGALPETVGDAGILIDGRPGSPDFITAFIEAADRLLSDDELFSRLQQNGLKRAEGFDWSQCALRLLAFLEGR